MNTKITTAEEEFDRLLVMTKSDFEISVFFGSWPKNSTAPVIERIQLLEEPTNFFRNTISTYISKRLRDRTTGDAILIPYDAGSKPDNHEIEHLDLESANEEMVSVLETIKDLAPINLFECEPDFVSGLKFYLLVIQSRESSPIIFFRTYSPKKLLSRSRYFGAMFQNGQFDQVKNPVFLFDEGIDCIISGNFAFIEKKGNFHRIFKYFDAIRSQGENTLKQIAEVMPITNFSEFKTSCLGNINMLAKLTRISGRPYIKDLTMPAIKETITALRLPIRIVTNSAGLESLVFDQKSKWHLLRLLDDDYVLSVLTGMLYETSGKRPLPTRENLRTALDRTPNRHQRNSFLTGTASN